MYAPACAFYVRGVCYICVSCVCCVLWELSVSRVCVCVMCTVHIVCIVYVHTCVYMCVCMCLYRNGLILYPWILFKFANTFFS